MSAPPLLPLLWTFSRPVDRWSYLRLGLGFAVLKYAGDAALVAAAEGGLWTPLDYLRMNTFVLATRSGANLVLWPAMAIWALPFLWVGISLTMRRAADAGVSPWLGLGFFVPYLNYVTMAVFALLPTRAAAGPAPAPVMTAMRSRQHAMWLAIGVSMLVGAAMALLSVFGLHGYGATLFLGTPFAIGLAVSTVLRRRYRAPFRDAAAAAIVSVSLLAAAFMLTGFEGAVCIAMAYPLALGLCLAGAGLAHLTGRVGHRASLSGLVVLPLALSVESAVPVAPSEYEVRSAVEIAAPVDRVWTQVVTFPRIAEPTDLLFRAGIAYPIEARIDGEGVGAVRYCVFSTGAFVEPITHWEPGRRLAFDVAAAPPPLRELSPYGEIAAPHLDGFVRARRGEFRLVPLSSGQTRLEGSTWYTLEMAPAAYWRSFSDTVIHRVHLRVLDHIRAQAER